MNCKLTRIHKLSTGIFSALELANGVKFYCASHAYRMTDDTYQPKLPNGMYKCVRGHHRLAGMEHDFVTFEIKDVPDFQGQPVTNILFHTGNFPQKESHGCELIGMALDVQAPTPMVVSSRIAFTHFMALQDKVEEFTLEVL